MKAHGLIENEDPKSECQLQINESHGARSLVRLPCRA